MADLPIIDSPPPPASTTTSAAPPISEGAPMPAEPGTTSSSEPHPNAPPAGQAAPSSSPPTTPPPANGHATTAPAPPREARGPVPFIPQHAGDLYRYAEMINSSILVPSAVRGSVSSVMHLLLLGHSIGLSVTQSLAIHIVEGKPCLPAQTILAICKRSPVCKAFRLVESTMDRAVFQAIRIDPRTGEIVEDVTLDFTIEEAEYLIARAKKNADKSAWATQPRTMLRWRAVTSLARQVFPDVILGIGGTEETMDALDVDGDKVRTVTVPRADVDGARVQFHPQSVDLTIGRPALGPGERDALDVAFADAGDRRQGREEETVPRRAADRIADRARQSRVGANVADGCPCRLCGTPVCPRPGMICDGCR
jgi:hypothetical protein